MKIVYYTSGISGLGRLVHGIALYNAFHRRGLSDFSFKIIHSAPEKQSRVLDRTGISHQHVPPEIPGSDDSPLLSVLRKLSPDITIVDRMWMSVQDLRDRIPGKVVFITSRVNEDFFYIENNAYRKFQPQLYDAVLTSEPFHFPFAHTEINPLIIRTHDEILPESAAREALIKCMKHYDQKKPICFIGVNYAPGFLKKFKELYSYLEEMYNVVYSTNMDGGGIFPIADYYNAIDYMVCSATYNFYWEARYFNKEAVFVPVPVLHCDQQARLDEAADFSFEENGADQLVDILLNLPN